MKNFLLVGLGGGLGSMLRYGAGLLIPHKSFPFGTLIINIAGSFLIGIIAAYSLKHETFVNNWKLFLATGICGGFTTFSAFSLESMQLLQNERYLASGGYIAGSVMLGILAGFTGFKLINA